MSYRYDGYAPTSHGFLESRPDSKGGYHGGADNAAKPGTPVYAEYGGEVYRSGPITGYGMSVIVKTTAPDGTVFYHLYGHLGPAPLPTPGTPIEAGKQIPGAEVGTTEYVHQMGGISTGPHLHREIISDKSNLRPTGPLGVVSSDITHKADPDTFDINHPVFPYEPEGAPLSPPQSKQGSGASGVAPRTQPQQAGPSLQRTGPPAANSSPEPTLPRRSPRIDVGPTSPPLSPGMAVPDAEGPTSSGGPSGPTPLMPPANSGSPAPAPAARPRAAPTLPPLQFAPEMPQYLPFTPSPSSFDASDGAEAVRPSAAAAAIRRLTSIYPEVGPLGPNSPARRSGSDTLSGLLGSNPNAASFAPVWSPPAAMLALGRKHALGDWVKPLPFNQPALPAQDAPGGIPGLLMQIGAFDPSHPDDPPADGLLRLIQDYMRNNPDDGATR